MRGSRRGWVGSRGKTKLILIVNLPKKNAFGWGGSKLNYLSNPIGKKFLNTRMYT